MTRLQVDAPRACGAAELQGVVEAQVDRLLSEGILTTAGRVGGSGKARASARSASPPRRTVKVKLPTYSLGGKRVSLETLLREKINQRTKGGANLLLR